MNTEPDLQKMVLRLLAAGRTQRTIADRIGCSQPTVSDIANGKIGKKRPAYSLVKGLEDLLAELARESAPVRSPHEEGA
jgi:transcriptional regulator with XRE-family HTH domain